MNGLWVLIALSWPISSPAAASARRAAGTGASGMWPRSTRACPNATTRISIDGSRVSPATRSGVVSTIAALPSAGWVWPPCVTLPPGSVGFNPARPSAVVGMDALVAVQRAARALVAAVRHRERQVHEAAQERSVVGQRIAVLRVAAQVSSSWLARSTWCFAATFSAVWIIARPAWDRD